MRRLVLLVLLVVSAFPAALALSAPPAAADCAAPTIAVAPGSAAAGQTVTITGGGFSHCSGTVNVCIVGQPCAPSTSSTSDGSPMTSIVVRFQQGTTSVPLATVNAADDGTINATVRVPASASPGAATIVAAGQASAPLTVTAPAPGATAATATSAAKGTTNIAVQSGSRTRGALPATGVAAATTAAFGIALLALGTFLVGLSAGGRRGPRTA